MRIRMVGNFVLNSLTFINFNLPGTSTVLYSTVYRSVGIYCTVYTVRNHYRRTVQYPYHCTGRGANVQPPPLLTLHNLPVQMISLHILSRSDEAFITINVACWSVRMMENR